MLCGSFSSGLEYGVDCPDSEAGQSSYSRNTLLTISSLRNGLWVALMGVRFPLTEDMEYMSVTRIRLVGHEDF